MKSYFEMGYVAAWEKIAATRGIKELRKQFTPDEAAAYRNAVATRQDTGAVFNRQIARVGDEIMDAPGRSISNLDERIDKRHQQSDNMRYQLLGVGQTRYNPYRQSVIKEVPTLPVDDGFGPILHQARKYTKLTGTDPYNKKPVFGLPPAVRDPAGIRNNPEALAVPPDYKERGLHAALTENMLKHEQLRQEAATANAESLLASGVMGADPTTHPEFKNTLLGRLTSPIPPPNRKPRFSSDLTESIGKRLRWDQTPERQALLEAEIGKAPSQSVRQLPLDKRPAGALPPGTPPRNRNVLQLTNVVKPGLPPSQWKAPR